ncbi:MAG: hypothetical protein Q4P17_11535, partial [Methanobacterium sp.]|nr:hypothetical protein [Methanobacterium sp.]
KYERAIQFLRDAANIDTSEFILNDSTSDTADKDVSCIIFYQRDDTYLYNAWNSRRNLFK